MQVAGVDAVAQVADVAEQFAFVRDAFRQRAIPVRERMPATGFGKALDQGFGLGIEEDQVHVDAALLELRQIARQFGQRRAAAYVDADRDAFVSFLRKKLHQAIEELGRQIVDAIVGAVLEHIERDALARTGKAADDDELHDFRRADLSRACSAAFPAAG